jgi:hypothetical protein
MTPPSGARIAIGVGLVMFWGVALVDSRPVGAFPTVNACADYRRSAQRRQRRVAGRGESKGGIHMRRNVSSCRDDGGVTGSWTTITFFVVVATLSVAADSGLFGIG